MYKSASARLTKAAPMIQFGNVLYRKISSHPDQRTCCGILRSSQRTSSDSTMVIVR